MAEDLDLAQLCVEVFASMEPDGPWNEPFLRRRYDCYEMNRHARTDLAYRELRSFQAQAATPFATGL